MDKSFNEIISKIEKETKNLYRSDPSIQQFAQAAVTMADAMRRGANIPATALKNVENVMQKIERQYLKSVGLASHTLDSVRRVQSHIRKEEERISKIQNKIQQLQASGRHPQLRKRLEESEFARRMSVAAEKKQFEIDQAENFNKYLLSSMNSFQRLIYTVIKTSKGFLSFDGVLLGLTITAKKLLSSFTESYDTLRQVGFSYEQSFVSARKAITSFYQNLLAGRLVSPGQAAAVRSSFAEQYLLNPDARTRGLTEATTSFGVGAGSAARAIQEVRRYSGFTKDVAKDWVVTITAMAKMNHIAPDRLFRQLAEDSSLLANAANRVPDAFARASIEAARMGVTLQTASRVGDKLTGDFESFLTAQAKLQMVMPGADLTGLIMASQYGGEADIQRELRNLFSGPGRNVDKMPRSIRNMIASAVGLSPQEMMGYARGTDQAVADPSEAMRSQIDRVISGESSFWVKITNPETLARAGMAVIPTILHTVLQGASLYFGSQVAGIGLRAAFGGGIYGAMTRVLGIPGPRAAGFSVPNAVSAGSGLFGMAGANMRQGFSGMGGVGRGIGAGLLGTGAGWATAHAMGGHMGIMTPLLSTLGTIVGTGIAPGAGTWIGGLAGGAAGGLLDRLIGGKDEDTAESSQAATGTVSVKDGETKMAVNTQTEVTSDLLAQANSHLARISTLLSQNNGRIPIAAH